MTEAGTVAAGSGLPRHEAERLLVVAAGRTLTPFEEVDGETMEQFASLASRRRNGEPLQYLEGTVQFGPLELLCDSRALIPRPETERLWELAVKGSIPETVVDLCTGSGCLALATKHAVPTAEVHGADLSPDALGLAMENGDYTDLDVAWHRGDLFEALPDRLRGTIDLLLSTPPYVAADEASALPIDVREHEPTLALVGGRSGLEIIERIANELGDWLALGGRFLLEIGETQAGAALELFAPFGPIVHNDLAGRPRIIEGRA
ncbi:MAG: peptide chain release factor N(5)-glutamine methyltransferase [Acidimicrobiia bacterium]|nr:peptide chain release factor N(5)-glutamine methyltransferase [Acidimicrobiia bacterium]